MAALSGPRFAAGMSIKKKVLPLAGSTTAYEGGMACIDTSAAVVTKGAANNANLIPIGQFLQSVDNSASTATSYVNVELQREIWVDWWDNDTGGNAITTANLFQTCYIKDDHTVTLSTGTGSAVAGRIWDVDSNRGVLVQMPSLGA